MTIYWSSAELLFLLGVAVVIACLVASEMLEAAAARRPVRTQRRGTGAAAQSSDRRVSR